MTTWSAALTDGAVDMELRYGCGTSWRLRCRRARGSASSAAPAVLQQDPPRSHSSPPSPRCGWRCRVASRGSRRGRCSRAVQSPCSGGGTVLLSGERERRRGSSPAAAAAPAISSASPSLLFLLLSSVWCGWFGCHQMAVSGWRAQGLGALASWPCGHGGALGSLRCALAMEGSRGQGNAEWRRLWRDGEESVGWGFL